MADTPFESKIKQSIHAPIKVDVEKDMRLPKESIIATNKKYICTCCGKGWDKQKGNFCKSASPLYQSNNGYINICNDCRERYYASLVDFYEGNEAHAVRHICQQFDIIFQDEAFIAAKRASSNRSVMSHYLVKKNLNQTTKMGTTFIDTLKYEYDRSRRDIVSSVDQLEQCDVPELSKEVLSRWGTGLPAEDYPILEEHYQMLKTNNPNCDNNQEIFVKTLSNINLLQVKATRDGDADKYIKLSKSYADNFSKAGLRTIEEKDSSNDNSFAFTLGTISKYTPEEFYKDKKLYHDFDHIGEYMERHILRPLTNLLMDQNVRDTEYFVPESGDGDDNE